MNATAYLQHAALTLPLDPASIDRHVATYAELIETTRTPRDTAALYRYRVPELGENGACSLPDQLAEAPYDLAATLGGESDDHSLRLAALYRLVQQVAAETGCGWLGVYQVRDTENGRALVKLAYVGKPSRAEFPLTPEFAEYSNNSTVGLSGKARLIESVDAYVAEGGAYYTCDAEVQSEACLPLYGRDGEVIGIIDAEDARPGLFQGEVLARLVALCLAVVESLPE